MEIYLLNISKRVKAVVYTSWKRHLITAHLKLFNILIYLWGCHYIERKTIQNYYFDEILEKKNFLVIIFVIIKFYLKVDVTVIQMFKYEY